MSDKSYSTILARPAPLFIGIDLGTSGCRAIAIDASGSIKARSAINFSEHQQQTPKEWWHATQGVLQKITSQVQHHPIQAIAVDGTSGTVLFCDDSGQPLTPALMYHDQRAQAQARFLQRHAPSDAIVLSPTSGLAKILWLLEHHRPEGDFHIVHQADWIAGLLCRRFDFSDYNNALKTGFDAVNNIWPLWLVDLLSDLKVKRASLPQVQPAGTVVAAIHPHVAANVGLPLDVDIVTGTTDSTAAFIASGAHNVGDAVTSLGSTLVLKVISEIPINAPEYGIYSQPYGKHWLVGGGSNSGGAVLRYYFSDEEMVSLSKQLHPEIPTNLDYYPLIKTGERFPINDPDLAPRVKPKVKEDAVFFQGLLEGIAEIEHRGYSLLEELGAPYPNSVRTTGGGVINKAWQQIREHKLGVPVTAAEHTAAAYGAALLAAKNHVKHKERKI